MNIILCHNFYQQPGGEDRVLQDEESLLRSHGHNVILFTRHSGDIKSQGNLGTARGAIWNRTAARELRRLVQQECVDLVHFHNTVPLLSPAVYYAARSGGAAVVQSLHNYRLICPKSTLFRAGTVCEDCLGKRFAWPSIRHACYRQSKAASATLAAMLTLHRAIGTYQDQVDRYIAMSEFSRQKLVQGGLPEAKIDLKPNFVSPDPGLGSGDGGYAMYLGRLSPEKGVEVLLEAWNQIDVELPLKIVGTGPLAQVVEEAAQKNRLIEYLGWRDELDVARILAAAACLIMPSVNYEGFPKTIVESLAQGTPVVASRLGAMAEVIDDGSSGLLFAPGDPHDLAAKISAAWTSAGKFQPLRQLARLAYEQRYTAELNYELLRQIYDRALAQRKGEPLTPVAAPAQTPVAVEPNSAVEASPV